MPELLGHFFKLSSYRATLLEVSVKVAPLVLNLSKSLSDVVDITQCFQYIY